MTEIRDLIQQRHSTRAPFDPGHPVAEEDLRQILEAGRWAPTVHTMQNFEVIVVDDPKVIERLGSLQSRISAVFLRENYQQLALSEEELLRRKVGILGTMFPPSWRATGADFEKVARESAPSSLQSTIRGSPTLLVVVYDPARRAPASEGDFLGIMSLGCLMENMWLMAESLGIGFQIMSVFGGETIEEQVKEVLGVPQSMKIAFAVRLAYPSSSPGKPLRVRRDVEDFVYHNRFGSRFRA